MIHDVCKALGYAVKVLPVIERDGKCITGCTDEDPEGEDYGDFTPSQHRSDASEALGTIYGRLVRNGFHGCENTEEWFKKQLKIAEQERHDVPSDAQHTSFARIGQRFHPYRVSDVKPGEYDDHNEEVSTFTRRAADH